MFQINIVGDVPFPVGNYTNIDQSAIKKPELVKTIIYSECNIKSNILLWQKPIQYSILQYSLFCFVSNSYVWLHVHEKYNKVNQFRLGN